MRYVVGVVVLVIGCASEVPTESPICDDEAMVACEPHTNDGSTLTGLLHREPESGVICRVEGEPAAGVWDRPCTSVGPMFDGFVCVTMEPVAYYEWWSDLPFCD